jgi:hypothetical protein
MHKTAVPSPVIQIKISTKKLKSVKTAEFSHPREELLAKKISCGAVKT